MRAWLSASSSLLELWTLGLWGDQSPLLYNFFVVTELQAGERKKCIVEMIALVILTVGRRLTALLLQRWSRGLV